MTDTVRYPLRRGATLIELLVVIGIMILLLAVTIPAVKPQLDGQASREGSRVLNSAVALAKSRAAELGRPVGLAFVRGVDGVTCVEVRLTETPTPYAGDFYDAKVVSLSGGGFGGGGTAGFDTKSAGIGLDSPPIINVGDKIRFNHQGAYYNITAIDRTGPTITFSNKYAPAPPPVTNPALGIPYQIIRTPITSSRKIDMPKGVAIDLSVSGGGPQGREFDAAAGNTSPVVIMFAPNGEIDRVIVNNTSAQPHNAVHLLVGEDDKVDRNAILGADNNLSTVTNVWVSIGHRTGLVTSSENVGPTDPSDPIRSARALAINSLTLAGN